MYLTSDAEESLTSLDPSCAYIIGGLVDRNRLKGATYQKAKSLGIRTAKLPIREHVKLNATHVLTVNHVLEILLNFAATNSWPEALSCILPKRKGVSLIENSPSATGMQRVAHDPDSKLPPSYDEVSNTDLVPPVQVCESNGNNVVI